MLASSAVNAVLADSLLLSTLAGGVILAAAVVLDRRGLRSGHVRHLVLWCALAAGPVALAGFAVVRPGPVGCIASTCSSSEGTGTADMLGRYYAFEAARKFSDQPAPHGNAVTQPTTRDLRDFLLAAWLTGAVVILLRAGRRRREVRRIRRGATPVTDADTLELAGRIARRMGLRSAPTLLHHEEIECPMVGGSLRPAIYLPVDFERDDHNGREMVLLHELAHVRRRDAVLSLLVELACAVYWFQPLIWLAARRCTRAQELAADSCVLNRGILPSNYADYLLASWRKVSRCPAIPASTLSLTGDCMLSERIHAVLDPATPHHSPARAASGITAALFFTLLSIVVWSPAGLQAAGLVSQEKLPAVPRLHRELLTWTALDSLLRPVFINRMTDRYVAGSAISIVHDGRLVYAGGFGDREVYSEDPIDPERTIFRIGSITKVLTGVAVMQLVERGVVDLEADVNRYLNDVQVPDTFDEPVTVRDLLTHTSGFDQIGLDRHAESPDEVVPLGTWIGANLVRIRPPGEVSAYDTYGITLAGHLIEAVSGLEYAEYLRRHIFDPLAMDRSGIDVPPALANDMAIGYGFAGEWEALPWEYMNTAPASSVNATVVDMAHFAAMLLGGGRFGDQRVLSERATREMLSRQYTNDPDQPGYGFTLFEGDWNGIRTFSHGGSMSGFAAMLYLIPEHDLGIFIASNQESSAVIDPVISSLLGTLLPDTGRPALRERYEGPIDLGRFTGTYANNVYHHGNPDIGWKRQPFALEAIEEGLLFDDTSVWPVDSLTFQRDDGLLLSFRADESGKITHLFVKQTAYEKLD